MTTKTKTPARPATPLRAGALPVGAPLLPLSTTEDRLRHIEVLGQRINGYVQFIAEVGNLAGTSAEAKDRAVLAFHERLVVLENHLGRIQEELRLG